MSTAGYGCRDKNGKNSLSRQPFINPKPSLSHTKKQEKKKESNQKKNTRPASSGKTTKKTEKKGSVCRGRVNPETAFKAHSIRSTVTQDMTFTYDWWLNS